MIFVVLAVLTLIISFVIALSSLIREQNKQMAGSAGKGQPELEVGEEPGQNAQSAQSTHGADEPLAKPLDKLVSEQIVDKDADSSREPFFWELAQQDQDTIEEAKSIEKVQQQLAAYKSQKQREDSKQEEENFAKNEETYHKLSGEFSLTDLK